MCGAVHCTQRYNIVMSDDNKMQANIALRDVWYMEMACMKIASKRLCARCLVCEKHSQTRFQKFLKFCMCVSNYNTVYDNEEKRTVKKMLFLKCPIFVW